ncbi:GntR family transcriptional regulator [Sphingomonas montanisoli]|uniref:GntR family transcriptional regulator n=1 Tax=Sphingomonas montanisoli TaxID=2606412 RepID=A0A5D9CAM8_9SPHN|nr:GntR family transcriptional regulator [Sphingomonas montanisoli]TZG28769.1 GntR family transcriptional regulator [Sphingomonas montanisoli]
MSSQDRPVYLRLRDIIAESILDGVYGDGDALPSVRAFAAQHGANPLTAAKAYQGFQDEDLVVVRRGVGMFVAEGASERLRREARAQFLDEQWPRVVDQMRRLRIEPAELLDKVS